MEKKTTDRQQAGLSKRGYYLVFPVLIILLAAIYLQGLQDTPDKPEEEGPSYSVKPIDIPLKLYFAGERVPLENFDTRESLDRELLVNTYFHSQTFLLIKKANRYFPVIEPILKKNGVPDDFKYIAVIESGLDNTVVSPKQAVGFWQLLEGTARDYGLEVNNEVDERYHIEKSTEAACKYILESYLKYGNWTLTAASYNAGRNGIDRQIDRQNETNYYDLLLNEETARYVFRALAIKLVITDPATFGFNLDADDLYPVIPYIELQVDTAVNDFSEFARSFGTNYKILKYFNPWLRETYLNKHSGKSYIIRIPLEGYRNYSLIVNRNKELTK